MSTKKPFQCPRYLLRLAPTFLVIVKMEHGAAITIDDLIDFASLDWGLERNIYHDRWNEDRAFVLWWKDIRFTYLNR